MRGGAIFSADDDYDVDGIGDEDEEVYDETDEDEELCVAPRNGN